MSLFGPPPGSAATPNNSAFGQAAAKIEPALVGISTTWSFTVYDIRNRVWLRQRRPLRLELRCTGFFVGADGAIATSGQCVRWEDARAKALLTAARVAWRARPDRGSVSLAEVVRRARATYEFTRQRATIAVSLAPAASSDRLQIARVLAALPAARGDVALIDVHVTHAPALRVATDVQVLPGQPVVSVRYPTTIVRGTIGRGGTLTPPPAATQRGSGGPVLDESGNVLGLAEQRAPGARDLLRGADLVMAAMDAAGVANVAAPPRSDRVEPSAVRSVDPSVLAAIAGVFLALVALLALGLRLRRRRARSRHTPLVTPAPARLVRADPLAPLVLVSETQVRYPIADETALGRTGVVGSLEQTVDAERHAIVTRGADGSATISRTDTAEPTFVNGVPVGRYPLPLEEGDVVRVGDATLHVQRDERTR